MCGLGLGALATAGGAASAAATTAGTLQTLAAVASIAAPVVTGIQSANAARTQAAYIEQQRQTEAQIAAVQDSRQRAQFAGEIGRQRAQMIARGVSLDSPTALLLGDLAAREMTFESQATRSGAAANDAELANSARLYRGQATQAILAGGMSAAGNLLTAAPDVWPHLLS